MSVILLTSDLMVVSHVQAAAARTGVAAQAASRVEQAAALVETAEAALIIIDLAIPSIDVGAVVQRFKTGQSAPPRIVAFGPHVHEERLDAARQAGCDQVISRGQFFSQVDAILSS